MKKKTEMFHVKKGIQLNVGTLNLDWGVCYPALDILFDGGRES